MTAPSYPPAPHPPGPPYRPGPVPQPHLVAPRPPAPVSVVLARVVGFVVLALELAWGAVLLLGVAALFGVGMLSIMWGPPCTGDSCGPSPWPQLTVGLTGCGLGLTIIAIALPVAWRRLSLWGWTAVSLVLVGVTAGWAVATFRSPF